MKKKKSSVLGCLVVVLTAILFVCCLIVGVGVGLAPGYLAGFNVRTDPFGAFGDRELQWWSYNETQNPKVAKFQYLKQHHEEFDSYIIGGTETSAYSVKALNKYFNARFYNLALYDDDMLASEQYCRYLLKHYDVKNIVLNVSLEHGKHYHTEKDTLTEAMPYQLGESSMLAHYKRYLFADPKYGQEKLERRAQKSYFRQDFAVFTAETGSFDSRQEDSGRIGDVTSYLQDHPDLDTGSEAHYALAETDNCMKSIAAIRELCDEKNVNLIVIASPVYQDYVQCFEQEKVVRFYNKLAEVTPYWDFSLSYMSRDPRYFYDKTHFRNSVGTMTLARIANKPSASVSGEFGTYVKKGGKQADISSYWQDTPIMDADYTRYVPILMYHHLVEKQKPDNWDTMSVTRFRQQIQALAQAGYTAVTFDDLRQYVNEGIDLPEKSVVITFDDGYASNYELAVPVLEEFGMKATVFIIGVSMGTDLYKDTDIVMAPHFSWEEAKEMEESGVIDIESHGYDIHEVLGCDEPPIRQGCLPREEESQEEYITFLTNDCAIMQDLFKDHLHKKASVFAYPYGKYSDLSEMIVADNGFDITLSVEEGNSFLIKGLPQSLKVMKRHFVKEETTPRALLAMMQS